MSRRLPWIAAALLLAAIALVAWFPARWAVRLAGDRLQPLALRGVSGSVWNGHARQLSWAGRPLGALDWTLARALLLGRVDGSVRLDGPDWRVSGRFRRLDAERWQLADVHAHAQLAALPLSLHGLSPAGALDAALPRVRLRAGWPEVLQGRIEWHDASLGDASGRTVALGNLYARLSDDAGTRLLGELGDDGSGPVRLRGEAELSPLGWRVDARLTPSDPGAGWRALLGRFGPMDANGRLVLERQGGLLHGVSP